MRTTQQSTQLVNSKDRWIPRYFVFFFLGLIAVQAVLVTLAVTTQTGIVTEHPYEKGLAYNQVVKASDEQAALGWQGKIEFKSANTKSGQLTFTLRDADGTSLDSDDVIVNAIRPTQKGMDFTAGLSADTLGHFSGQLNFPIAGVWDLRVFATVNGTSYQQSKRIVVQ